MGVMYHREAGETTDHLGHPDEDGVGFFPPTSMVY
jgi:hypothetical protein